jgi:hypothetical protein
MEEKKGHCGRESNHELLERKLYLCNGVEDRCSWPAGNMFGNSTKSFYAHSAADGSCPPFPQSWQRCSNLIGRSWSKRRPTRTRG